MTYGKVHQFPCMEYGCVSLHPAPLCAHPMGSYQHLIIIIIIKGGNYYDNDNNKREPPTHQGGKSESIGVCRYRQEPRAQTTDLCAQQQTQPNEGYHGGGIIRHLARLL